MAIHNVAAGAVGTYNHTLSASTVDTVGFAEDPGTIEVISNGSAPIYVTIDGTAPTVGGPNTYLLPAVACSRKIKHGGSQAVKLISSGTPIYGVAVTTGDPGLSLVPSVETSRLDQVPAPEADVDLDGFKIVNLADPDDPQDAATRAYVLANGGTVPDADASTKGKLQLAGDLGGTAASPTVPGLAAKAPLASPTFTGNPTAPTPAPGDNDTSIATSAFVKAALDALVAAAPGTLDTLDELAAALGDDANFAATLTTALALKAPLASPTLTGTPTVPTAAQGTNTTQAASTAYVQSEAGLLVPKSLVDAKGDLLVGTADNTVARKAAGVNGLVLRADSAQSDGLLWADPSGQEDPSYDGVLAQSWPLVLTAPSPGNLRPTSGRLEGVKIPLPRTITSAGCRLLINQVGVTLTAGQNFVAFFNSAGSRLALTADQSTAWLSTGQPTDMTWAGGPVVIPGGPGVYGYLVILSVGSTTVGVRGIAASPSHMNTVQPAAAKWAPIIGGLGGQTSIPSSVTLSSNGDTNNYYWGALI